jgi:hypothetical protein
VYAIKKLDTCRNQPAIFPIASRDALPAELKWRKYYQKIKKLRRKHPANRLTFKLVQRF